MKSYWRLDRDRSYRPYVDLNTERYNTNRTSDLKRLYLLEELE